MKERDKFFFTMNKALTGLNFHLSIKKTLADVLSEGLIFAYQQTPS